MKKFLSLLLLLTMIMPFMELKTFAVCPSDLDNECMNLNKMLEQGYWTNVGLTPVCGCKTCGVLLSDYRNIPGTLKTMELEGLANHNIIKEYRAELGKDISAAVGKTALSVALLNAHFLREKGLENVAETISSKVGSKFYVVRVIASGIAILSGGVWYKCKMSADEASRIIKMTEDMLETLSTYVDRGYWKGKNYLMISYDRKDGTSAVKFGKHRNIKYSGEEYRRQGKDFEKLSKDAKALLKEIRLVHEDYQRQLEMKRNNKWYKTFVTNVPNVLFSSVFTASCIGKLIKMFEDGHIPTSKEFNNIISETLFKGEISEKQKAKTIKSYSKAYKVLSKEGKKNPDEFIKMSINNLYQIRDYNRAAVAA